MSDPGITKSTADPVAGMLERVLALARERQKLMDEGNWGDILDNHSQRRALFPLLRGFCDPDSKALPEADREVIQEICRLDDLFLSHLKRYRQHLMQDLETTGLARRALDGYGSSGGVHDERARFTDCHR